MKKTIHRLMLIAATVSGSMRADDAVSQTFLSIRPQFQFGSPEKESIFRNDRMSQKECGIWGALDIVPFGGQSTNANRITKYFFPFNKATLLVAENGSSAAANRDVDPQHFNIETLDNTFQSTITMCPQQSVAAVGFDWKQSLSSREDGCIKWWLEVVTSVVHVQNKLNFKENVIDNGGGALANTLGLDNAQVVGNMTQAFNQSTWKYGKIGCKPLKKTGLADIEIALGWNACHTEMCHYNGYAGVVIPTGNKPKAHYVFEPIVGNNKHVGIMYGSNMGFKFWECGDHTITGEIDINGRYLFRNKQRRSFDLFDKSWSRYMETYASLAEAQAAATEQSTRSGTSGINLFTDCVKVSPRFSAVVNSAFIYKYHGFELEVGYNFYGRQAEKVSLCFDEDSALKDAAGLGNTTIARTIGHEFSCAACPDVTIPLAGYTPITTAQINIDSAATPAAISNIIYATGAYNWDCWCFPTFVGLGGSYEFSHVNTAIQRWTVWGKLGMSF
ncbi:MAG: hypothetical protein WC707_04480 [Candidatus Babeliaceae bacterium]